MSEVSIRPARRSDLEQINALYNHYVRDTPVTFDVEPIPLELYDQWFEQFAATGPHRLLVADTDGRILGYAASKGFRPKAAYRTSIETSIYLAPDCTRKGLGIRLYTELFGQLRGEGVHRAYAGITLPNTASVGLHQRLGFRSIGVYREVGYKLDRYWDVEWFEKDLE